MQRIKYFLIVAIFIFAGFFLINNSSENLVPENIQDIKYVKIAGQMIEVELALTPPEQGQGFSGRSGLSDNKGMLFVFDRPGKNSFWMKDMNFSIDIIWIGEDLRVVYIKKDARPESYPEVYGSNKDAKYVLEVVSGFSDKNNLKEGDRVEFIY